ncbi:phage protein NinX family protein [Phytobacter sp. AG2a]
MKIKTAELSGRALDWAVAIADRQLDDCSAEGMSILIDRQKAYRPVFDYSGNWEKCGPLIEKFKISCYASVDPENGKLYHWVAVNEKLPYAKRRGHTADDPKIAICRAVVASKLGDEVDIPDELMESQQ